MKTDEIKGLLEKYYLGESSLEEEKVLREYLLSENQDPMLEDDKQLFAMFSEAQSDQVSFEFEPTKKVKNIEKEVEVPVRTMHMPWYFGVAAAISFLITGLAIGYLMGSRSSDTEMMALRNDISQIKAMTIANKLNAESASDRILATYEVANIENVDGETILALINTMTMDEHVNVRIAAADALFKFGNQETVRNGFIQALKVEEDPNLQIRLINMLVNLQEKRALPRFKEMMENQDNMQVVRETAAHGVSQLL